MARSGNQPRENFVHEAPEEILSCGVAAIDRLTEAGGISCGTFTEIAGMPVTGKTALGLAAIKSAQRAGGAGAFIDANQSLSQQQLDKSGIDKKRFLLSSMQNGRDIFSMCQMLVESGNVEVIVIDALPALLAEDDTSEVEGLKLTSILASGLRKLKRVIAQSNCSLIMINQLQYRQYSDGSSQLVSPGGNPVKLYPDLRIQLFTTEENDGYEEGIKVRAEVVKGFADWHEKECFFEINFNKGLISG